MVEFDFGIDVCLIVDSTIFPNDERNWQVKISWCGNKPDNTTRYLVSVCTGVEAVLAISIPYCFLLGFWFGE